MSWEKDFTLIDIEEGKKKIKIWVRTIEYKVAYEIKEEQEEKIKEVLKKEVKKKWGKEKEKLKKTVLEPLEILDVARAVFDKPKVKKHVMIDISEIEAWKLYPKNPTGWCPAQVQGIGTGNVGFFVSLDAITKQLIERLPKMNDKDKKAYLLSLLRILFSTSEFKVEQKNAFIKMLEDILEELENE